MLKAAPLLVLPALAGLLAASALGSAPAPANRHSAPCKAGQTTRCAKPKRRTVTVTRTRTVTAVAATTQTITGSTTQTVTVTQPYLEPRVGLYHGTLTNGVPITFEIAVRPGGFSLRNFWVNGEIDLSCTKYLAGLRSADILPIDARGHIVGTASGTALVADATADGRVAGTATFSADYTWRGTRYACTGDPIAWSASL
jgi:hypothetical protein